MAHQYGEAGNLVFGIGSYPDELEGRFLMAHDISVGKA
jgi:hypothetical protein